MPSLSPAVSRGDQSPEDLDRRLGALFRARMPHPWPPAPAALSNRKTPPRWPLLRSRLALAASVALLVTGLSFLAGAFQARPDKPHAGVQVVAPGADLRNDPVHNYNVKVNLKQPLDGPTSIQVDVRDLPSPMK